MNIEQMWIAEFEKWWEQFKREHEEWKWADKEALLYQAWEAALMTQAKGEPDFNESLYEWRWYTISPQGLKYTITPYYRTAEEAQAAKGLGEGWRVERIESTRRPVRSRTMTDRYESRASTHADICWSWGPGHYKCAVGKIERLQAENERLVEALETCLEIEERPRVIEFARAALAALKQEADRG